jgi:type VI protein secretion system component Hcp
MNRRLRSLFLAGWAAAALAVPVESAVFLRLEGVVGESKAEDYTDWIEILSFNFSRESLLSGGSPMFFGAVKQLDKSSPPLMESVTLGNTYADAVFEFVALTPTGSRPYSRMRLQDVQITHLFQQAGAGDNAIYESVGFAAAKSEFTTFQEAAAPVSVWWNFMTNVGGHGLLPGANTAPTITSIDDLSINQGTNATVSFTIGDAETPAGSLGLFKGSSNLALVPLANIVFGGSGSNRSATITPAAGQHGQCVITINVSDGGLSASSSFLLTVNPASSGPTISPIGDQVTQQNQPVTVEFTIGYADELNHALSGDSSNPTLLPPGNIVFAGSGTERSAALTPAPGQSGSTVVTITLTEGKASAQREFNLTVNAAAGLGPVTLTGSNVPENSPEATVIGTLSTSGGTPPYAYTLTDSAGGRFAVLGNQLRVADGSLLDYETATSHSIVVRVDDAGGLTASAAVTIAVTNVNEMPQLAYFGNDPLIGFRDEFVVIEGLSLYDPDGDGGNFTLTLQAGNGVFVFFGPGVTVVNSGTAWLNASGSLEALNAALNGGGLSYHGYPNFTGNDTIQLTLNDNGYAGAGGPLSASTAIAVAVFPNRTVLWRTEFFTAEQLADPSLEANLWGDLADPNGDGIPNLLAYALGLHPLDPIAGPMPTPELTEIDGQQRLSISFVRVRDSGLEFRPWVSSSLSGPWETGPEHVEEVELVDLENGYERVTYLDRSSTEGRRFFQLEVIKRL